MWEGAFWIQEMTHTPLAKDEKMERAQRLLRASSIILCWFHLDIMGSKLRAGVIFHAMEQLLNPEEGGEAG